MHAGLLNARGRFPHFAEFAWSKIRIGGLESMHLVSAIIPTACWAVLEIGNP